MHLTLASALIIYAAPLAFANPIEAKGVQLSKRQTTNKNIGQWIGFDLNPGEIIQTVKTEYAEVCSGKCDDDPDCDYYVQAGGDCYIKQAPKKKSKFVWKLKDSENWFNAEFEKDFNTKFEIKEDDKEVKEEVKSKEVCYDKCLDIDECQLVCYDAEEKECFLKKLEVAEGMITGGKSPITSSSNNTPDNKSGRKDTPVDKTGGKGTPVDKTGGKGTPVDKPDMTGPMFQDVTFKVGTHITQIPVESAEDCSGACEKEKRCDYFAFPTSTKLCHLFEAPNKTITDSIRIRNSPNWFMGTFGDSIGGRIKRSVKTATPEECYQKCLANTACYLAVRSDEHKKCSLFALSPEAGTISGGKSVQNQDFGIILKDVDIPFGRVVESFTDIVLPGICHQKCMNNENCEIFVSNTKDGKCDLKYFDTSLGINPSFRVKGYIKPTASDEFNQLTVMEEHKGISFPECRTKCNDHPQCHIVTYLDTTCTLRSAIPAVGFYIGGKS